MQSLHTVNKYKTRAGGQSRHKRNAHENSGGTQPMDTTDPQRKRNPNARQSLRNLFSSDGTSTAAAAS